jgi:hypothetical protein
LLYEEQFGQGKQHLQVLKIKRGDKAKQHQENRVSQSQTTKPEDQASQFVAENGAARS